MRRSVLVLALAACSQAPEGPQIATREELGEVLFNDPSLSEPPGQACADCHLASAAFADPEDERTSAGVLRDRFGSRNAPTAMYTRFVPPLHETANGMTGGLMWDGRAASLEAQAAVPLLNPLEMNNPDEKTVARKVRAKYAGAMQRVFGRDALDDDARLFAHVTDALGAFQRSAQLSPFSSRYDQYLAGTYTLDAREKAGLDVFEDPARGNCASCHPSRPAGDGSPPLFTTFGYADLRVPPHRDNPFYRLPPALNPAGEAFVDRGLATTTKDTRHDGMFRIPTLRNVARTTPYGHNGYFRRLDEMIAHIDDVNDSIRLSREDIAAVVTFLETLTDANVEGYR